MHGRLDLLQALVLHIASDALAIAPDLQPVLILLGDYVDRGSDSAGVLQYLTELRGSTAFDLHALRGNHEEALTTFLDDPNFGPTWVDYGGAQTLASYAVKVPSQGSAAVAWQACRDAFDQALPVPHRVLLSDLELMVVIGDYVFVHAGLRPGTPLEEQTAHDLMWIRGPFLSSTGPYPKIVVHGHTVTERPKILPHRIALDTGAYATGTLSAIRLSDTASAILQARRRTSAPGL